MAEDNHLYEYRLVIKPPIAGYWYIAPDTMFSVSVKPNWFHRWFIEKLLGWKWKDAALRGEKNLCT